MNKKISKVAVLGAGVMGSRIACHLVGTGHQVLLLDIVPKGTEVELKNPKFRNSIVSSMLDFTLKAKPSPIYDKSLVDRITIGNFDDDLKKIADCDWIIEVVTEKIEIKRVLYEKVDVLRKKGSYVSSNTSGIPMAMMCDGRSEDFQEHFFGTHFFNPPRYLTCLEIIPGPKTKKEILNFFMEYGFKNLGKETILCKDTIGFIGNRVGVHSMMKTVQIGSEMGLGLGEVDDLTGKVIGHAKSATFRTADVVGIDTLHNVMSFIKAGLPNEKSTQDIKDNSIVAHLVANKWLGDKTGQGFFKKSKTKEGKSEIQEIDFATKEYKPITKATYDSFKKAKESGSYEEGLKILFTAKDKAGDFTRRCFADLFQYVSLVIPEITDCLYSIDGAMRAGFNWKQGPFEAWDTVGVENAIKVMEELSLKPNQWVYGMIASGVKSFYKIENGKKYFYDIFQKKYLPISNQEGNLVILSNIKSNVVWKNEGTTLYDIGDGVLNLEFHTKMNAIGGEVLQGVNKSIEIAEKDFKGLVIGNEGDNFSAGANLSVLYMFASQQEFDEIYLMVSQFQATTMRARYSSVPVVAATSGLTLGGGCELMLHCADTQVHSETYVGLVETGVGLIPGGGGVKEMAYRMSQRYFKGDIETNLLEKMFSQIAMAKVSTSAAEGVEMGYLKNNITFNRKKLITDAKQRVLALSENHAMPQPPKIKVMGRTGLAALEVAITSMVYGGYISDYDAHIGKKLGYVLCGGDLTEEQEVSEKYLLELEKEAFVSLCGEQKTIERIHSILFNRKPLRN